MTSQNDLKKEKKILFIYIILNFYYIHNNNYNNINFYASLYSIGNTIYKYRFSNIFLLF